MLSDRITIKGTNNGLMITMGPGVWPGLLEELDSGLTEKASFFKGGRVALCVGPRQLTSLQLEAVGQILSRHKVTLWAVESDSAGTLEVAAQLGLETSVTPTQPNPVPVDAPPVQGDSLLIQRTLRSGQVVDHAGHVVVIGDVNPGAEIRAGGSVVVWGRLRGSVHAGAVEALGNDAVICALQLSPTQLRIGNKIARAPAEDEAAEVTPEMASIQDGRIVAEPWDG